MASAKHMHQYGNLLMALYFRRERCRGIIGIGNSYSWFNMKIGVVPDGFHDICTYPDDVGRLDRDFPTVPSLLEALILHRTVNAVGDEKIVIMANLQVYWYYTKMMHIPKGLIAFGIRMPNVPFGIRHIEDGIGVGTASPLAPSTSRHSDDNVGAGLLASILFTCQCCGLGILAAYLGAHVFVRVPSSTTHQHKHVCAHHCKTDPNILMQYMILSIYVVS